MTKLRIGLNGKQLEVAKMVTSVLNRTEDIVGKEENAGNKSRLCQGS